MTGALFYLLFHSWKNRLMFRIRRLKQPKYLFGAIFGAAYFYFYFYRRLFGGGKYPNGGVLMTPEKLAWIEPLGAAIIFLAFVLGWLLPTSRAALVFTEAEVAFLFPAPVARQKLVHFKLLKSQARILFTSLFFTIIFRRVGLGGQPWMHAVGWWVILSAMNLHSIGASFARTMLMDHGISNWKRRTGVLVVVAALVGGVYLWAKHSIPPPDIANFKGLSDFQYYLEQVGNSGPAFYLLYPFRFIVRPYLEPDLTSFLLALGPALGLLGLHYLWVVKSNVAFEEASVEASRKAAERMAAMRAARSQGGVVKPKKKKRAPFKLRPVGFLPVGLLWKNLIGAGTAFTLRFWLVLAWIAVMAGIMSTSSRHQPGFGAVAGMMSLMLLGMSFLAGPQIVRQDFRRDLRMADLLKSYPLAGWEMAMGQLLAPLSILTGVQWLLLIFCVGMSGNLPRTDLPLNLRLGAALGVALLAPVLNLVTLIIPNAAVLMFPGWFQTSKDGPQGFEATGQRLIFMLGQLLVLVVALVPAAAVFLGIFFVVKLFAGMNLAIPCGALGAAVILGVEGWLGVMWLGRLFEKFDVAAEGMQG